ncbi:MAG: hypothetical protein ACRERE_34455, partial [Candidatus Entotheonellia bacterium]
AILPPGGVALVFQGDIAVLWDRGIGTNMGGTFLCTKHVLPHMEVRRSGHIINLHDSGPAGSRTGRAAARPAPGLAPPGAGRVQCASAERIVLDTRVCGNVPCITGELRYTNLIRFD